MQEGGFGLIEWVDGLDEIFDREAISLEGIDGGFEWSTAASNESDFIDDNG